MAFDLKSGTAYEGPKPFSFGGGSSAGHGAGGDWNPAVALDKAQQLYRTKEEALSHIPKNDAQLRAPTEQEKFNDIFRLHPPQTELAKAQQILPPALQPVYQGVGMLEDIAGRAALGGVASLRQKLGFPVTTPGLETGKPVQAVPLSGPTQLSGKAPPPASPLAAFKAGFEGRQPAFKSPFIQDVVKGAVPQLLETGALEGLAHLPEIANAFKTFATSKEVIIPVSELREVFQGGGTARTQEFISKLPQGEAVKYVKGLAEAKIRVPRSLFQDLAGDVKNYAKERQFGMGIRDVSERGKMTNLKSILPKLGQPGVTKAAPLPDLTTRVLETLGDREVPAKVGQEIVHGGDSNDTKGVSWFEIELPSEKRSLYAEKPIFAFKEKPREGGIPEEARAIEALNQMGIGEKKKGIFDLSTIEADPKTEALRQKVESLVYKNEPPVFIEPKHTINWWNKQVDNLVEKLNAYLYTKISEKGISKPLGTAKAFIPSLGKTPEMVEASRQFRGEKAFYKDFSNRLGEIVNGDLGAAELKNVGSALHGEIKPEQLSPTERASYDSARLSLDYIHEKNYGDKGYFALKNKSDLQNKKISKGEFENREANRKGIYQENLGKYAPNLYEFFEKPTEENVGLFGKDKFQKGMYRSRKEITKEKQETLKLIENPGYMVARRLLDTGINTTLQSYIDWVDAVPELWSKTPKKGYYQLPEGVLTAFTDKETGQAVMRKSTPYNQLSGKFVRSDVAADILGTHVWMNETFDELVYPVMKLYGGLQAPLKKLKTVYNPAVRVGNRIGDELFGILNGVPFIDLHRNLGAAKREIVEGGAIYKSLLKEGIVGTDYSKQDLGRLIDSEVTVTTPAETKLGKVVQKGKKAIIAFEKSYGIVDDQYKVAAYTALRNKGFSHKEAVSRIANAYQNYAEVGKGWDVISKTPLVGKPFIKFTPQLVKILANSARYNPLRLAAFLGSLAVMAEVGSNLSGETDKQRHLREESDPYFKRILGFIPAQIQTPIGEIDLSRWVGMSQLTTSISKKDNLLSQIGVPDTLNLSDFNGDVLLSPLYQAAVNKKFNGKEVFNDLDAPLTKALKVGQHLVDSYSIPNISPAGIDKISAAFAGRADQYGKKRELWQAFSEIFLGLKIQKKDIPSIMRNLKIMEYKAVKTPKEQIKKEIYILKQQVKERVSDGSLEIGNIANDPWYLDQLDMLKEHAKQAQLRASEFVDLIR